MQIESTRGRTGVHYWVGFLFLLLPTLLAAQVPDVPPQGVSSPVRARAAVDRGFRNGLVLIAFQAGATPAEKDSAVARIHGRVIGGLPIDGDDLDGWYLVQLEADEGPVRSAYYAGLELAYLPWVHTWTRWGHRVEAAMADLSQTSANPVGDVLIVQTRARSVWGNLEARFAPFQSRVSEIRVDRAYPSGEEDATTNWVLESVAKPPSDSASIEMIASPDGSSEVLRAPGWVGEPGVGGFYNRTLIRSEPGASLLPFLFGPAEEEGGVGPWIHTVALGPADSPSLGRIEGMRVISFLRDSVVSGVGRFLNVRDSTRLAVRRNWGTFDYGLGDTIRMSENLEGTVLGEAWFGPLGLISSRQDTIVLHGKLRGEFPDGRVVEVPLRFEAERALAREDPNDYLVEFSEESRFRGGGAMPIRYEPTELEQRLLGGDPVATDSVLSLWRSASDPEERQDLFRFVSRSWDDRTPSANRRALLQEGDTALWLDRAVLAARDSDGPPLTYAELEELIPFLDNPARMWGIGRSGGDIYSGLMRSLTDAPPALTPDTSAWALTPRAFELLGSWMDRARDPRLRDFATFAWFILDPAPRYAALEALGEGDEATFVSQQGLRFANGAAQPGESGQVGVPPVGSPAEQWTQWAGGPHHLGSRHLPAGLGLFRAAHPNRDLDSEVAARYRDATTEDERSVFRSIGQLLGVVPLPSPEDIVASVANGGSFEPFSEAIHLLLDPAAPAPDSVVLSIMDRLLEREFNGTPLWERLRPQNRRDAPGERGPTENNLFLLDEGLPPGLHEAWADRIPIISREEWGGMDPRRRAQLLQIGEMQMAGPLLYLSYSTLGRLDRAASQPQHHYASGSTMYLALWEGEWWILGPSSTWIT